MAQINVKGGLELHLHRKLHPFSLPCPLPV